MNISLLLDEPYINFDQIEAILKNREKMKSGFDHPRVDTLARLQPFDDQPIIQYYVGDLHWIRLLFPFSHAEFIPVFKKDQFQVKTAKYHEIHSAERFMSQVFNGLAESENYPPDQHASFFNLYEIEKFNLLSEDAYGINQLLNEIKSIDTTAGGGEMINLTLKLLNDNALEFNRSNSLRDAAEKLKWVNNLHLKSELIATLESFNADNNLLTLAYFIKLLAAR